MASLIIEREYVLVLQVVVDCKDRIFTWGFGGYGRLGHDENKDELVPRLLKFFDGPNRGATMIAAGSTFSIAVNKLGEHRICCIVQLIVIYIFVVP